MHSAAQTPLLALPLLITASCCTQDKRTVGNDYSPKASGSCVILTVRPAWSVGPYGRGDATDAVSATAMHHFGNFVLETLFRTVGSLGIRTQLAEARLLINSLRAHSKCLEENPWMTARGTSSFPIETNGCSCRGNKPYTSYSRTNGYDKLRTNGYDIAYTFTHNNITLEHNAMNNKNTIAHMDVHNTQY